MRHWPTEMIGRGRPCLGHLDLAPFGGSNRSRSSWPRATSLGATAPEGFRMSSRGRSCSVSTSRGRHRSTSMSSVVSTKSASCPTLPSPPEWSSLISGSSLLFSSDFSSLLTSLPFWLLFWLLFSSDLSSLLTSLLFWLHFSSVSYDLPCQFPHRFAGEIFQSWSRAPNCNDGRELDNKHHLRFIKLQLTPHLTCGLLPDGFIYISMVVRLPTNT